MFLRPGRGDTVKRLPARIGEINAPLIGIFRPVLGRDEKGHHGFLGGIDNLCTLSLVI
jgi:hypothetical protein